MFNARDEGFLDVEETFNARDDALLDAENMFNARDEALLDAEKTFNARDDALLDTEKTFNARDEHFLGVESPLLEREVQKRTQPATKLPPRIAPDGQPNKIVPKPLLWQLAKKSYTCRQIHDRDYGV